MTIPGDALRRHALEVVALLLLLLAAAGSFYQLTSGLFWCGVHGAGNGLRYWSLAAAVQSALFLVAAGQARNTWFYRASQLAVLPFLGVVLFQLASAYPAPFLLGLIALGGKFDLAKWSVL